jgi:hypothetical protein
LFIGNSLTYFNGGVDAALLGLRRSSGDQDFVVHSVVQGGASLKRLWQKTKAKKEIGAPGTAKGHDGSCVAGMPAGAAYDAVVLQEDLPETTVELFGSFAAKFVGRCREHGATPVLYGTWAYDRLGWIDDAGVEAATLDVGRGLGVDVAKVGAARARLRAVLPDVNLWADDNEHPSPEGTYLAALVLHAALGFGSARGLGYAPEGVAGEVAESLQRVAEGGVADGSLIARFAATAAGAADGAADGAAAAPGQGESIFPAEEGGGAQAAQAPPGAEK